MKAQGAALTSAERAALAWIRNPALGRGWASWR